MSTKEDSGFRSDPPALRPTPKSDGSNVIASRFDIGGRVFVARAISRDTWRISDPRRTALITALMYVDLRLRMPPLEFDHEQLRDIARQAEFYSALQHLVAVEVEEIDRPPVRHVMNELTGSDWVKDLLPTAELRVRRE